jgi:hypothetical protein
MKFDWWKLWKAAICVKVHSNTFQDISPPTAIDVHESYEVIKGLIAETLHSGVASAKASD